MTGPTATEPSDPIPTDVVDRIQGFRLELARRCATTTAPSAFGAFYLHDGFPKRYDSNYLWVDGPFEGVSVDDLVAETDRVLGGAGLEHREILVEDAVAGARVAWRLRELGWWVDHLVLLAKLRDADRPAVGHARRVDFEHARPLIEEIVRRQPPASSDEVVRQLVEHRRLLEEVAGARFFVVEADGAPASICELYVIDGVAQIEDVNTLEEHRGLGLARAVVLAAVEQASELGCDVVFLTADDEDWPKRMYAKLGFDPVGRFWGFVRPSADGL